MWKIIAFSSSPNMEYTTGLSRIIAPRPLPVLMKNGKYILTAISKICHPSIGNFQQEGDMLTLTFLTTIQTMATGK